MLMESPAGKYLVTGPFGSGGEEVFESDVGEGAAGHDAIVAAAGAVAVEIERVTPCSMRNFPAALSFLMSPAGEM
jgi:hypothetical protein